MERLANGATIDMVLGKADLKALLDAGLPRKTVKMPLGEIRERLS